MRKTTIIAAICISLIMQFQLSYGYAKNSSSTLEGLGQAWLDAHKDSPQVSVSGDWDSEFGVIHLNQEGLMRDVKGMGGGYEIRGVVSGKNIYLLFLTGKDSVDYCAVLTQENNQGFYGTYYNRSSRFNHHELCQDKGRPISMKKTAN